MEETGCGIICGSLATPAVRGIGEEVSLSVNEPASQQTSHRELVGQSASQPTSHPVSRSTIQPASWPASQPVNQPVSQFVSL